MTRIPRDFRRRAELEQRWLTENTWCERCSQADLGITDPVEYEEDGRVLIEGKCRRCGERVVSSVAELNR